MELKTYRAQQIQELKKVKDRLERDGCSPEEIKELSWMIAFIRKGCKAVNFKYRRKEDMN